MIRAQRIAPAVFIAGAVALVFVAASGEALHGYAWRVGIILVAGVAIAIGQFVNRMPWLFALAGAIGAARVVTLHTTPPSDPIGPIGSIDQTDVFASGITGIALVTVLTMSMRRRRGPPDKRDLIDGMTVAISASLVAWILIASRLMALHDVNALAAIGAACYLPISIFLFTFIVDLLFAGLRNNRALQLVTLAATLNLAATIVVDFGVIGVWDARPHLDVALFASAFLAFAAALVHPDAPETVRRSTTSRAAEAYTPLRLSFTGACLVFPGALLAALDSVSRVDVIVRLVAIIALVGAVLTRLLVAVTGQELAHRRMVDRLQTDELTGLSTRPRFITVIAELLEHTWRSEFQPTIIQVNLDRFKNINDTLGHDEANDILVTCGDRLEELAARFGGHVARLGGDDFVLFDGTTTTMAETMERVDLVRASINEPVPVGDGVIFVTASVGVAVAPRNRTLSADELLRRADIATHRAKESGRNGLVIFDDSMQRHLAHQMDVEHALHGAIARHEMRLYYQAIVDLTTGNVNGFEALLRWRRNGVIVPPLEFIPVAEETGIIVELGAWAINEALRELRGWIDDGIVGPDTTVSVNVSPRQIANPGFCAVVEDALATSGVPAELLWLEVTESMMLDEPEIAHRTLESVRDLGVRLALDDFGTGYSSLSLLQQFPIQRIKIDRAFVQGIAEPGNDRSLVRTIIAMARSMGLDLVAEGVETVHQLRVLEQLTCDQAQGFLISHPVPADAMRSTMVALGELTSLSLFGSSEPAFPTEDLPTSNGKTNDLVVTTPRSSPMRHTSAPIGTGSSRPLGQPVY